MTNEHEKIGKIIELDIKVKTDAGRIAVIKFCDFVSSEDVEICNYKEINETTDKGIVIDKNCKKLIEVKIPYDRCSMEMCYKK